jgi:D-alanine-D-alanine ligase
MATHGSPGEDGRVQSALDDMGLFYTGAGLEGCVLSMNKWSSKAMMQSCGVHTPKWMMLDRTLSLEDHVQQCAQTLGYPLVLKPTTGGSSIGVRLARDLIECRTALATMATDAQIMAEQCIQGREVTVSILEDDNGRPFVLPIMELEPQNLFYDYETKLSLDKKDFSVPANLTQEAEHQLKQWSLQCHRQLMMRDCSRSDFMIDQDGDLYYLETNAIPGLTENSDLPAQASAAGLAFEEVVLLMLKGAWRRSLALR